MKTTERLQKQRFEFKYRISENKAQAIRFFCRDYLEPDNYGVINPGHSSYPVHSIYIDSPCYKTYHDTINGNRNRYKLRLRYYEESSHTPVFFEVKRRQDQVIYKTRSEVKRPAVDSILTGKIPGYNDLVYPSENQFHSLMIFSRLLNLINARPALHISYLREAWERNNSNSVRITFDRSVKAYKTNTFRTSSDLSRTIPVFGNHVILELKFTNRFPEWLQELVQKFNLRRESAAKYVDGLVQFQEQKRMVL